MKAPQTMVRAHGTMRGRQTLIWAPEPEVATPKVMPLPNVVSVAPPKVVRPFVAPPEIQRPPAAAAPIADAPSVRGAEVKAPIAVEIASLGGPRRAFTPPPNVRMQRQAMIQLPEGPQPQMVVDADALPFPDAGPRPQPRKFVAPPAKPQSVASVSLPAAPEAAGMSAPKGAGKSSAGLRAAQAPGDAVRAAGDLRRATHRAAGRRGDGGGNAGDCGVESGEDDPSSSAAGFETGGFFGGSAATGGRRHGRQPHRAAECPGTGGERRRQGRAADTGGELLADIAGESAGRGSGLDGGTAPKVPLESRAPRRRFRRTRGLTGGWYIASPSRCRM